MMPSPAPLASPAGFKPVLPPGVIEVWRVRLDVAPGLIAQGYGILSPTEQAAAARFQGDVDRHRFVVRRAVRRWLLAGNLGVEPGAISFVSGPHGKPAVPGLHFNAASTGDLALIGLSADAPLGLDTEAHRPLGEDLGRLIGLLAPEEQDVLGRLPPARRETAFYDCWTRKEAFLKALGCGLAHGLDRFAVTVDPAQPAALLRVDSDASAPSRWALFPLAVGFGFSATLAGPPGATVVLRDWEWP